jgi:hypothetical protein
MHRRKLGPLIETVFGMTCLVFLATSFVAGGQATLWDTGYEVGERGFETQQQLLSPDERARLSDQALKYLQRSPATKPARLRILSIKRLPGEKWGSETAVVGVLVFNYTKGNATRLILALSNGSVIREEHLRGRPQPSEEELEEAQLVIRSDAEQARMLQAGSIIEGGFVVDPPKGQSIRSRCLLFQVLSSDRKRLQRDIIVNLTTGRIVESGPR